MMTWVANRRGSRSLSPSELRELYGLTMREIYSAERSFLKESYNKDRQDLQYHLDALATEHASKLREIEHQRKMFIRAHEKIIRHPSRKKTYQKTFSVTDLPESAVPPCIPYAGVGFPPKRHARSSRSVSELRSERLLSRNTNTSSFTGVELVFEDDCDADVAKVTYDSPPLSSARSEAAEGRGDQQRSSCSYRNRKQSVVVQARPKSVTSSQRDSRLEETSIENIETAVTAYASRETMDEEKDSGKDKVPLIHQNSTETFSRQDTPSKGSDVTSTSLDDDRLLQELHEHAQHMLFKSKWVNPEEIAQLRPSTSLSDGSLSTPRPDSELLGQSPQPESLPTAVSPSTGNTSVIPQEERDGRGNQVKEMVDEWLDQLHIAPKSFSKTNIRSEWQQLCERIANLHTDQPDDGTADEDNEEGEDDKHSGEETEQLETDGNIKPLIPRETTSSATMTEEKSREQGEAAIHTKQTLNVRPIASTDHLNQKSLPAQSDIELKNMTSSAEKRDSKTSFLGSVTSSKQLSATHPFSKPKYGAPYLPVWKTSADQSITSPRIATDHRENLRPLTAPDARRHSSEANSTSASFKTGQPPTDRLFRRRANTTDNRTKPVGAVRTRAKTASDCFCAPQPPRGFGHPPFREKESNRMIPRAETALLTVPQLHNSPRRLSADSGYTSNSEDRRSSFSTSIAAPESDTVRDNVHTTGSNSRTTVTRIPSTRAIGVSYAESAHKTGQSSDCMLESRRVNTAPDKRPKSLRRSAHSPNRFMRSQDRIESEITPRFQSQHSVTSTLPSATGATKQNLTVPDLVLPPSDDVPEKSLDGKRVSFSNINWVQSVSSQSLNTDVDSHADSERGARRPRISSNVPNTGSRPDSDSQLRRLNLKPAVGSLREGDRRRPYSSFQTRPDVTRTFRKSHSAQPEFHREVHVEDMTLEEYQNYLRKEMSPPEQEVMLHTDARGRQHKLLVSKVSLHGCSSREANITILHEDNADKSNMEEAGNETDDEMNVASQEVSVDATNAGEEPISRPTSSRKGSLSINQSRSSSIGADEDENLALWRKRLAHPHRASFSWIPEFAQDKDAQALALALLARKRGIGERADKFKAVAQALAIANHLLQKRQRETMMVVEELRHCRYLRMPAHYMAEEFQELPLAEVFT